jgi:hypothetical protein
MIPDLPAHDDDDPDYQHTSSQHKASTPIAQPETLLQGPDAWLLRTVQGFVR